ncbi:iron-containing alcohol dehydrogenase [Salmonella enterica subsp. enterica]|nr:iron-containing alcohol dehydrogenase [Salmonella enterica subsp. enterica]
MRCPAAAGGNWFWRRLSAATAKAIALPLASAERSTSKTCVAIPTTSGTVWKSPAPAISDPLLKASSTRLFNNALYPMAAILTRNSGVSVPPQITANTGMGRADPRPEARCHRTPATLPTRWRKAAKLVFQYLPYFCGGKGDCVDARGKCTMLQRWRDGIQPVGLGLNHAIAHQLGGQFHLPHGLANALLSRR